MRQRGLGDPVQRVDVRLERLVELGIVDVLELLRVDLVARVVDEDVQPAQLVDGALHELGAEATIADVPGKQHGEASLGFDHVAHVLGVGLFGGQIGDGDIGPLAREGDGHRRADARVAARDERLAAGESSRAAIGALAVVRVRRELHVEAGEGLTLRLRIEVAVTLRRIREGELVCEVDLFGRHGGRS